MDEFARKYDLSRGEAATIRVGGLDRGVCLHEPIGKSDMCFSKAFEGSRGEFFAGSSLRRQPSARRSRVMRQ